MRYADILKCEICNGLNTGISLFVQGCDIHCEGCFNSSAWDFSGGKPFTDAVKAELFNLLRRPYIERITILGGEPLCKQNVGDVYQLIQDIRSEFGITKKIWIYTGYIFEELAGAAKQAALASDVVVDGPFIAAKKDFRLAFKGSANQRIIDIKRTIDAQKIVELNV